MKEKRVQLSMNVKFCCSNKENIFLTVLLWIHNECIMNRPWLLFRYGTKRLNQAQNIISIIQLITVKSLNIKWEFSSFHCWICHSLQFVFIYLVFLYFIENMIFIFTLSDRNLWSLL